MAETGTDAGPQLAAPGAGLPRVELLISRVGFRLGTPFLSRERAGRWFRADADRMLALVRGLDPAKAAGRVLIKRLGGLEDSSRFWSAFMTLEHLVIVNRAILGVIESLVAGRPVPGVASTAAVKPGPGADAAVVGRFEAAVGEYLDRVGRIPDLRTRLTHAHPWFGELSALGWHRLAAVHHGIHRKQLEAIVRGLGGS